MAKIDAKGRPQGKYLNSVFRIVDNKVIMQGKPSKQKQTKKTKQAATDFGTVQKCNRQLRHLIQLAMNNNHCRKMHLRMNTLALAQLRNNEVFSLGQRTYFNTDLSGMVGFDFNTNTPFGEYCTLPISFLKLNNHKTRISIDTSTINDYFNFENNTSEIKVELFIQYHQLNYQEIHKTESISFTVKKGEILSAKEWIMQNTLESSITLVVGQLWYLKQTLTGQYVMINNREFHPSSILYLDNGL
ncbi:hypothetical protein VSP10_09250 [Myroides odoratimimus]|uniref:hypothetical protein n=1 Tax=Myroides odoratimimus TaxID=76832 RepID=UPI002DBC0C34|nr:hypothetical protein [Myroides odoratimimus]MEC4052977.1 hypothetical protein [Myroides odoratimimus]